MFLRITKVSCLATEDDVGNDDLYITIGPASYPLGQYGAGTERTDVLERPVPADITQATFFECDPLDPDDELGSIDLTSEMDVEHVFATLIGNARYVINFVLVSQEGDRCTSACPTCGGQCRKGRHGGTVHWCGQHEWGAN